MNTNLIGILILSYNEELHLERCILNAKKLSDQIFVVDSFSTDATVEILNRNNINYIQNSYLHVISKILQYVMWMTEIYLLHPFF